MWLSSLSHHWQYGTYGSVMLHRAQSDIEFCVSPMLSPRHGRWRYATGFAGILLGARRYAGGDLFGFELVCSPCWTPLGKLDQADRKRGQPLFLGPPLPTARLLPHSGTLHLEDPESLT